jgi:hypothetical protein
MEAHENRVGSAALSVRMVQRQLAALLPEARIASGETTLELISYGNDAPRLISATVLEGSILRARRVVEIPSAPGFRAFLDGTQKSDVAAYIGTAPVVVGHAAAVIRERRNRRMHTWRNSLGEDRVYVPRALVSTSAWITLSAALGSALVDTTAGNSDLVLHPFALRDAARHLVQAHREQLEQRLAERWCALEKEPLFIDGGISGSERVAASGCAIGVVKSHRTLYAEGDALAAVLSLGHRERSSVIRITSTRTTVASWYLRLRDHAGRDPMWGLVRAEIAHPDPNQTDRLTDRADEVSRWILAEASPLALPDARWDKMVYGIRDCEEYLRGIA